MISQRILYPEEVPLEGVGISRLLISVLSLIHDLWYPFVSRVVIFARLASSGCLKWGCPYYVSTT